jgi:hypothetical protein
VNEERARQGMEHLQAAAIEVISAVRAFLDIAEDVVRDPGAAATMAASLLEARPVPTGRTDGGDAPSQTAPDSPRVTRIRVS